MLKPTMEFCRLATERCPPNTEPASESEGFLVLLVLLARRMDDRRLSLRLSSLCSSRMAFSMELVMDRRSADASRAAMLPRKAPDLDRLFWSGVGWLSARLAAGDVRTMGLWGESETRASWGVRGGELVGVGRTAVFWVVLNVGKAKSATAVDPRNWVGGAASEGFVGVFASVAAGAGGTGLASSYSPAGGTDDGCGCGCAAAASPRGGGDGDGDDDADRDGTGDRVEGGDTRPESGWRRAGWE